MLALTIWQPWASLIMAGAKPYEFRRRRAPASLTGQRIVIHAGKRAMERIELYALLMAMKEQRPADRYGLDPAIAAPLLQRALDEPKAFPLGAGLGTAVLGESLRAAEIYAVPDSSRLDHHLWGWSLSEISRWEPVRPMRGAQGFWPWPADSE